MQIFIPGGAGLVGIHLIAAIKERYPNWELIVVDKKYQSIQVAEKIFPSPLKAMTFAPASSRITRHI